MIASNGPPQTAYLYAGEQWDPDLGTYYLRARYYSPQSGRFWTRDIVGGRGEDPSSLHKYLYCGANPANNIDPSGRAFGGVIEVLSSSLLQIWNKTKEAWVIHPIRSRILVTLSVLGGAWAGYDFYLAPGTAGLRTISGQKQSIGWSDHASAFTDILRRQAPASVRSVAITGHADEETFKIGREVVLLVGVDGSYRMNDERGDDILLELSRVLVPGAQVYLNGCHSAELARKVSTVLSNISVFGYRTYVLGGSAYRANSVVVGFGSRTEYINGQRCQDDDD